MNAKLADVGRVASFLVVRLLKCPTEKEGNIPLASVELGYKKVWKLDIRFSSALSQRGPRTGLKWESGEKKKTEIISWS